MTLIAVSILNYNGAASTIACVQSLLSTANAVGDQYTLEVFVADNASGNNEQQQLQQAFVNLPLVSLYLNAKNLGFAAGHNRNLQTVFKQLEPDYVWLLNNDCLVDEAALSALIKSAQHRPDVGVWGATLLEFDGCTIQCAGGCLFNFWLSSYKMYGHGKALAQLDQLRCVDYDYIAGASLFFPATTLLNGLEAIPGNSARTVAEQGQWLNERFFLYFEELDLVQRLKPGLKIAWCKGALIQHAGGVAAGTSGHRRSALAEYYSTLSALKFMQIYFPHRLWLMAPLRFLGKSLLLALTGNIKLLGSLTRAYRDFLLG